MPVRRRAPLRRQHLKPHLFEGEKGTSVQRPYRTTRHIALQSVIFGSGMAWREKAPEATKLIGPTFMVTLSGRLTAPGCRPRLSLSIETKKIAKASAFPQRKGLTLEKGLHYASKDFPGALCPRLRQCPSPKTEVRKTGSDVNVI